MSVSSKKILINIFWDLYFLIHFFEIIHNFYSQFHIFYNFIIFFDSFLSLMNNNEQMQNINVPIDLELKIFLLKS